jgi:hypothetical protein
MTPLEITTKKCCTCFECKPITEFYTERNRKDGLGSRCKICAKDKAKESRLRNTDKLKDYMRDYRIVNKESISISRKDYRSKNREKEDENQRRWYQENKEHADSQRKIWYQRTKHLTAAHRRMKSKLWKSKNKYKVNADTASRRARHLQATPFWLNKDDYRAITDFYRLSKFMEGSTGLVHHVDHIVPLRGETVCGLHVPWNLQVLTAEDNLLKNNKLPSEKELIRGEIKTPNNS